MGISEHLDDADLQQLVDSKTNRAVEFSYQATQCDGKQVGVIAIPCQTRPLYLERNFGKLEAHKVYFRRGSSTDIATPNEIAEMGRDSDTQLDSADIQIVLAEPNSRRLFGAEMALESIKFDVSDHSALPPYGSSIIPGYNVSLPGVNGDYYREFADFLYQLNMFNDLGFRLLNVGDNAARNARLAVDIDKVPGLEIRERGLRVPEKNVLVNIRSRNEERSDQNGVLHVQESRDQWHLIADFATLQPGAYWWTTEVRIGSTETHELNLVARLYADNLPSPSESELTVKISAVDDEPWTAERVVWFADTGGVEKSDGDDGESPPKGAT